MATFSRRGHRLPGVSSSSNHLGKFSCLCGSVVSRLEFRPRRWPLANAGSILSEKDFPLTPRGYHLPDRNRMFAICDPAEKIWKRWRALGDRYQPRLAGQQITPGDPGTILKDVNTFLEFIGPGGLVTQSSNATLPSALLPQLNAKSCHPIQLPLKRPLLRDYPNLAGIFILLRVMDLLQLKGSRLAVNPAAWTVWQSLNFTEQYFALLDALLFHAHSSILAATRNRYEEPEAFAPATLFLGQLSERWREFNYSESVSILGPQGHLPSWHVFALQQFGILEIRPRELVERERTAWGGRGWLVGAARLTPWGAAVTWALLVLLKKEQDALSSGNDAITAQADEPGYKEMALPLFDGGSGGKGDQPALSGPTAAGGGRTTKRPNPGRRWSSAYCGRNFTPIFLNGKTFTPARVVKPSSARTFSRSPSRDGKGAGAASGAGSPCREPTRWTNWREPFSALSSLITTTCTTFAIATSAGSNVSLTTLKATKGRSRQKLRCVKPTWRSRTS